MPADPPAGQPMSRSEQAFHEVLRFLYAVGKTPSPQTDDITDSFRNTFSRVVIPKNNPDQLHQVVMSLQSLPAGHVAAVLTAVNETTRLYFNKIVLELSIAMRDAMPELGDTSSLLLMLIEKILPAVAFLPEVVQLQTVETVRGNYQLTYHVAQLMHPEMTATIQKLSSENASQSQALGSLKASHQSLASRLAKLGCILDDESKDASSQQKQRSTVVILLVFLVFLLIAVVVLSVFLYRKGRGDTFQSRPSQSLGGVDGGGSVFAGRGSFPPPHTLRFAYDNMDM